MGSYTTLLSVKNIYILSYFLNIMNWDRTLHYCLSGIFKSPKQRLETYCFAPFLIIIIIILLLFVLVILLSFRAP